MNLINFLTTFPACNNIDIGDDIVKVIQTVYNGIRIGVPIILIIVGMIGMGKAITQQKEDEIKKAQSLLVKQAIAAVLVFLMLSLVSLVIGTISTDGKSNMACVKEILTNKPAEQVEKTAKEKCEEQGKTWDSDNGVCN